MGALFIEGESDLLRHHPHHLQTLVRVTPFVVIPDDHLHKDGIEGDAGIDVEDRSAGITTEVSRDSFVFGAPKAAKTAWPG